LGLGGRKKGTTSTIMAKAGHMHRKTQLIVLTAAVLAWQADGAAAQETGNVVAGHQLARTWCVTCHVVEPGQTAGASSGAPSFAAVAQMSSTTPRSLRVFLQTPHGRMPDLHLSNTEIGNISAYILSLRQR
jgi:mono/diheme cytochrome c family protein